ncbi:MAG: glycosyltransferase family 4 protein [Anaerolineae bacterium]|nr:glycosyltransferase family 4 protein [Anaerolineae bacterium]
MRDLVSALVREDHETIYRLFVAGASARQLPPPPAANFDWRPTPLNPRWLARLWHRLHLNIPVEVFTGDIHLYHATDFVLPPTRPQTRTVLQVHDLSFVRVPEAAEPRLKAYLDRVVPASVRAADHVLADSQATRNDLIELYTVPPEKVTVLYGGVDRRFGPVEDSQVAIVRQKYNLGTFPFIFSLGTVQPRKNYGRLIEALARLREGGLDVHLVIAGGRGWLEDPIYATIEAVEMQDFVHFIGFVDEADLAALYSASVCFAFPSLYEGFGLPVLEAMACQTPVLTSNVSSLPEVAGDAALQVDPYAVDAITASLGTLLTDSPLREVLVQRGLAQVKKFDWQASAAQLHQIYQNVLDDTKFT